MNNKAENSSQGVSEGAAPRREAGRDPKASFLPLIIGVGVAVLIVAYMVFLSVSNNADKANPPAAPSAAAGHTYDKILSRDEARAAGLFDADSLGSGRSVTLDRHDWPAVVAGAQIAAAAWDAAKPASGITALTAIAERGNALDNDLLANAHPRDQLPSMSIEATQAQWADAYATLKETQPLVPSDAGPALERALASIEAQLAAK